MANEYEVHLARAGEFRKLAEDFEEKEDFSMARVNYIRAGMEFDLAREYCTDPIAITALDTRVEECEIKQRVYEPRTQDKMIQGGEEGLVDSFEISVPNINFDNVAGMTQEKEAFYKALILPNEKPKENHPAYANFVPEDVGKSSGVILYGPPGCGKTYITKAVTGEAKRALGQEIPLLYAEAKDILSSLVGVSEKNLYNLFKESAEKAPAVMVMDEIEGIGTAGNSSTATHEKKLVNQFLASFNVLADKTVLVIGTTNRPWEMNAALLRSGRFSYQIRVDPPDFETRKELFQLKLRNVRKADNIDFDLLAESTGYYATSDIDLVCKDAGVQTYIDSRTDPKRVIETSDLLKQIQKRRSSLYIWADNYKKHSDEVLEEFADLEALVDEIIEHRITHDPKYRYSETEPVKA